MFDAYIAGFFDGEGSIGIYVNGKGNGHSLRVQVAQNETAMSMVIFTRLCNRFGGSVGKQNTKTGRIKLNWQTSSTAAAAFLGTVLPFLYVKKEQAILALAWHHSRPVMKRNSQGHPVSRKQPLDWEAARLLKVLKKMDLDAVELAHPDLARVAEVLSPKVDVRAFLQESNKKAASEINVDLSRRVWGK